MFFFEFEHIDVLFQTLQWMNLPATIDVQWQRSYSAVWYGKISTMAMFLFLNNLESGYQIIKIYYHIFVPVG